jgi:hypothetical protein
MSDCLVVSPALLRRRFPNVKDDFRLGSGQKEHPADIRSREGADAQQQVFG